MDFSVAGRAGAVGAGRARACRAGFAAPALGFAGPESSEPFFRRSGVACKRPGLAIRWPILQDGHQARFAHVRGGDLAGDKRTPLTARAAGFEDTESTAASSCAVGAGRATPCIEKPLGQPGGLHGHRRRRPREKLHAPDSRSAELRCRPRSVCVSRRWWGLFFSRTRT